VGTKTLAIVLVLLAGAVAAYDIRLVQKRRDGSNTGNATAPEAEAALAEENEQVGQPDAFDPIDAEARAGEGAGKGLGRAEPPESDNMMAAVVKPSGTLGPAGEPSVNPTPDRLHAADAGERADLPTKHEMPDPVAAKLPPIFQMKWDNPFGSGAAAAVQPEPETNAATDPTAGVWRSPFAGRSPVVSAVLICDGKRAIINGRIVREGDSLPDIGAEVVAITASGVELKTGSTTRFVPVSAPRDADPGSE